MTINTKKYGKKWSRYSHILIICFTITIIIITIVLIYFRFKSKINTSQSLAEPFTEGKYVDLVPKKVYCCWTGLNPMSANRLKCYESIKKNIGVELILVTPQNLNTIIHPNYPLHKSYDFLSYTHKADYLRTYLMHIYGGGYTDIKQTDYSWDSYFDMLNNSDDKWALGTNEPGAATVACSKNCEWVADNWNKVISNCAYIFRKQTPFTTEWFNEMNTLLDSKYEELKANPAQVPDDHIGKEITTTTGEKIKSSYPLKWAELLGDIFHPLCYKYHDKLIIALPPLNIANYR